MFVFKGSGSVCFSVDVESLNPVAVVDTWPKMRLMVVIKMLLIPK